MDNQSYRSPGKIRVLIVDDSALVRKLLRDGMAQDPDIEVIGAARDPFVAADILEKEQPDVITLDVEMPRMDGVSFLRKYMSVMPTPTVMISSLTEQGKQITLDALEAGAVDIIAKPRMGISQDFPAMMDEICQRVKAAATVDVRRHAARMALTRPHAAPPVLSHALDETTDRVIAIGASAGGVSALARILPTFPPASPGIVMVQHMPAGFTASFAERLDHLSAMQVKEAQDGDRIRPGLVLLAPGGDRQMEVQRSGGEYRVRLKHAPKESGHCPSVDVLFRSVAAQVGRNAVAAILTGMGADGAIGLGEIRRAGGRTYAQDEQTCVVFGMPQEAWKRGSAEMLVPLDQIPQRLLDALHAR